MTSIVNLPYEYFFDPDSSKPISNGFVYVGVIDLDPEIPANQLPVTLRQEDGTEVIIDQSITPIRTGVGGGPEYNGSPVQVLVDGAYSIKVLDSLGAQKFYSASVTDGVPLTTGTGVSAVAFLADLIALDVTVVKQVSVSGRTVAGDGFEGDFNFIQGNQSVNVTADPLQGIWVAPASDPTGASGAWKRAHKNLFLSSWFGENSTRSDNEVPINAAFDYAATFIWAEVVFSPVSMKTSAPIVAKTPYHGAGYASRIKPQGAFEAINVAGYTGSPGLFNAEIYGYVIDYTDVGAANITSACHGHWLLKGTTAANQQLANVTFRNIEVYRGYDAFYQSSTDIGQQWVVSYDHIFSHYCKDIGISFDMSGASSSLQVKIENSVIECSNNIDTGFNGGLWTTSKGVFLKAVQQVTLENMSIARPYGGVNGTAINIQDDIILTRLKGVQVESVTLIGWYYDTTAPVSFLNVNNIEIDIVFQTPIIDPGAGVTTSYMYFDASVGSVLINQLNEVTPTITTGTRIFFYVNNTSTVFLGTVLDPAIVRTDSIITPRDNYVRFEADDFALESNRNTKREFAGQLVTVAATAKTLFTLSPYVRASYPSGLYIVQGSNNTTPAIGFTDLILVVNAQYTQTIVVVSSNDVGAADARTYAMAINDITVSLPVNPYTVTITGLSQAGAV